DRFSAARQRNTIGFDDTSTLAGRNADMALSELTDLAAHELGAAIAAGDASCRDVMQAFLDRIAALNPRHNAIVSLRDGDELLLEADRADLERTRHGEDDPPLPFLFGLP